VVITVPRALALLSAVPAALMAALQVLLNPVIEHRARSINTVQAQEILCLPTIATEDIPVLNRLTTRKVARVHEASTAMI